MLIERGSCTFVTKVRNAEYAGASIAVVIDNRFENVTNVIMGDDGTGFGIRIPSMLIGKTEGKTLVDFTKTGKQATINVEFAVKKVDTQTVVEFWYSSNNVRALDFLKEFSEAAKGLKGYMKFTPRFVTYPCPDCEADWKADECYSDGKYCAPNHIRTPTSNIKGQSLLREDLRMMCLYDELKKEGKEEKWWDYVQFVHMECFDYISTKCSKEGHEHINFDYEQTKQCVDASFEDPSNKKISENKLLKKNAEQWQEYGSLYWPAITINRVTFRGDLNTDNILEDVCASLSHPPKVCTDFYREENITYEVDEVPSAVGGISVQLLVIVVCVLVLVNVALIFAYR